MKNTMNTVIHIIFSHNAFDDRVFYKEAVSLAKKYRTIILSGTKDGFIYDMGGKQKLEGTYSGVEIYSYPIRKKKNAIGRFVGRIYRNLHIKSKPYYSALFDRINTLKLNPSIVHIHEPELLVLAEKFKKKYSCKIIFDCHEYYYIHFQTESFLDSWHFNEIKKSAYFFKNKFRNCDAIIGVTKTMEAVNWFLCPNKIHTTIQNSTLIDIKKKESTISYPIRLVHEGSMSFNRGLKLMIEMFSDSWFRENVRLKIVGELKGEELNYYSSMLESNPYLKDCINITGWIAYENLKKYLDGDIGIIFLEKYPNYYLSMPNKLFNYVGANMPVLTVDLLEINRTLDSYGIGEITLKSISSIKSEILKIVDNYQYYLNNIKKAKIKLNWEHDEKKLFKLYEEILE